MRTIAAIWGGTGVIIFLGYAIYGLIQHMAGFSLENLSVLQWLVLAVNVFFMAYSEGYKGFQQNFSPRVAARVLYLSKNAGWINGIFAPAFCLGYFGTTRRRQFSVLVLTTMILGLVTVVSHLPHPWRGIVDVGVIVGLLWGLVSLVLFMIKAFRVDHFPYSPELPYRSGQQ